MKLFKQVALAASLLTVATASAEVVNNVYTFANFPAGKPTEAFAEGAFNVCADINVTSSNNLNPNGGGAYANLNNAGYSYDPLTGCIALSMYNGTDANLKMIRNNALQIVDLGGTAGKVFAIVGHNAASVMNQHMQDSGIPGSVSGATADVPFWDIHFLLDPDLKLSGKRVKISFMLNVLHMKGTNSHILNYLRVKDNSNGLIGSEFKINDNSAIHRDEDNFDLTEWDECSFVVDFTNNTCPYDVTLGLINKENFSNGMILIRDIIVQTTDEALTTTPTFTKNYFTVGALDPYFESDDVRLRVGEVFTNTLHNVEGMTVNYSSSNPEVATVGMNTGEVTALTEGMTVITATTNEGQVCTYTVTVVSEVNTEFNFANSHELETGLLALTFGGDTQWDNSGIALKPMGTLHIATKDQHYVITKVFCNLTAAPNFVQEDYYRENGDFETEASNGNFTETSYWGPARRVFEVNNGCWPNELTLINHTTSATFATIANMTVTCVWVPLAHEEHPTFVVNKNSIEVTLAHPAHTLYYKKELKGVQSAPARSTVVLADDSKVDLTDGWNKVDGTTHTHVAEGSTGGYDIQFVSVDHAGNQSPVFSYAITPGGTTGIDAITVDDAAEAIYYNMQGIRVENPANGLYIELKGNTTRKVRF